MDLSLGSSCVPTIAATQEARVPAAQQGMPAMQTPRSMLLAAQVATNLLIPSAFVLSHVASRRVVFPARQVGADREEKVRNELVRRVKNVVKAEAAGQQTQGRS